MQMLKVVCEGVDVAEIYSPPRVTKAVELLSQLNICPALAIDLTTEDEMGQPWDFSRQHMKDKARSKLRRQKPDLLVGSPMCTMYSPWQRLNKVRSMQTYKKRLKEARRHSEFVRELYEDQLRRGKLFLHEHP